MTGATIGDNPRLRKFVSLFGENWLIGRYLLPVLKARGKDEHGVVLDLACGASPFREFFPNAARYMRMDLVPADEGVIACDMRQIPLQSQSVDLVLVCQALPDVPHPGEVLSEIARVLRPGGTLIVFETMAYPEHDAPHDYYRLMPGGLEVLGADAGLRMRECIRLGGLFGRFASLWNNYIMGWLKQYRPLCMVGHAGIGVANLACYGLDRLVPRPSLASDYVALLVKTESDGETRPRGEWDQRKEQIIPGKVGGESISADVRAGGDKG